MYQIIKIVVILGALQLSILHVEAKSNDLIGLEEELKQYNDTDGDGVDEDDEEAKIAIESLEELLQDSQDEDLEKDTTNLLEQSLEGNLYDTATLIAINKITAKSEEINIRVGQANFFGNIEIQVYKCRKSPDNYNPDNQILLKIIENNKNDENIEIFSGWLLSQSNSLVTFEHPVYEVFAVNCTGKQISE